jgi:cytochrome P450
LRGLAAARWFTRFLSDPVGLMREMHARGRTLEAVGRIVPTPGPERLHLVALGVAANRRVLADPRRFRTTGQVVLGPRGSAQRRLRHGLTRSQGRKHDAQRTALLPAFQRRAVDGYGERMIGIVDKHLSQWTPGSTIDLRQESLHLNLRISGEILFAREDPAASLRLGEQINEWLVANFRRDVMLGALGLPTPGYRAQLRRAEALEREIMAMVEEKRASGAQGDDVVSVLVRAHDAKAPWMSHRDLMGQCTILFGASYETTASALGWTLLLLAQHPEIALALVDEIDAVLGGAPPRVEDLARMPRIDAAIRESMRVLPPVPHTVRAVTRRTRFGDYVLAPGDRVVLSHFVTHHLPDLYPEPERFLPDRWSRIRRGPYEFLPFSAGPRMCIGPSFANLALKISVAMILQRFRLSAVPGLRIDPRVNVTLAPRDALSVQLHPADRGFVRVPLEGRLLEWVDAG